MEKRGRVGRGHQCQWVVVGWAASTVAGGLLVGSGDSVRDSVRGYGVA